MSDVSQDAAEFAGRPEVADGDYHGEYKVPGGKLVAVDVSVDGGRLARVSVSGDFFLEPDDALEDIDAALTGMPTSATAEQLSQAISGALRDGVQLIGFNTEAVGIAVRRALGHATGWDDHTFDLVPATVLPPVLHVALDEVIAKEVAAGTRPPTLRFWDWDSPLVVIGSFQSYRNEIDPEGAARHHIDVVRRISGGGAMFMEPGNCITYSLAVPSSLVEGLSFERSYAFLDEWVIAALADIGVQAKYVPLNDIASTKGKIAGAAQKRYPGVVLHHVTMAYDIDAGKMLEVLRIGREKLSDKGTKSADKRVDPMRSQTGMARADILDSFAESFRRRHATRDAGYTAEELAAAEQLVDQKFGGSAWTHRVP